jgi:hypothetical protein
MGELKPALLKHNHRKDITAPFLPWISEKAAKESTTVTPEMDYN